LRDELMPLSTVITPNLYEAAIMSGLGEINSVEGMEKAAKELCKAGARTVLIKGGSKLPNATKAIDVVCTGGEITRLETELIPNAYTHGAGCTISAAICANLAIGMPVADAIMKAKEYEQKALKGSFPLNRWVGPLRHAAWRGL
jgi:pyridoxine kinase